MEDITQKLFNQIMELWILPEIKKRKQENRIKDNFSLKCAQIIFSKDRGWNKVRLNNEVKAIMQVKANKPKNKGDTVYYSEINNIETIELTKQDPNCGHITLLQLNGQWIISFNFVYNKAKSKKRIDAASEFLESAEENLKTNRLRPFFENSFACAELLTEAILITFFNQDSLTNHRSRLSKMKEWAELGNVKIEFQETLELLTSLRSSARYMSSTEFKSKNPQNIVKTLHEMKEFAIKQLK